MAGLSSSLFSFGVIFVALGFAAHVGHAVMLANGRRLLPVPSTAPRSRPTPGVVTGSFVTAQERAAAERPRSVGVVEPAVAGGARAEPRRLGGARAPPMLLRAYVVGRGPWGNMFEFSVAFAFSMIGGYLFLQRRYPIRTIGFLPLGVALAILLYASSLPSEIKPLVPALQNAPLLTIHVGMAVLSYGIFATCFAAGVGVPGPGPEATGSPGCRRHQVLDEVAYRAVIIGFPIFATMIILGSWWASIAWSRYWGWDPKETAALVTWLIYAVYLHARNQRSWAGRPAALLLVVGFGMVLVTYSGSLWFSGLHAYSGL